MNEWLNSPVSPDASERVHGGVMQRIRRRRHMRRGAGVLALLALLTLFLPATPDLETLTLTAPTPPGAPAWAPPPAPRKLPVIVAKATSRPAERITIYTDDPDVVIVLVADRGDE